MHVHFHIIPRYGDAGLGITWKAGSLDDTRAGEIVAAMRRALERS
jgi:diadenosine tetraphosphate (Ap4A) HIT family hydrolase